MNSKRKIGLIGLDTSHVEAFARLLNDPNDPAHIPGAQVVVGYPGGSSDMEVSFSRVDRFTSMLRDDYGVEILDTPEAVAEQCDLLMITAVDGRVHRDLFEKTVRFGRPTFIDKPFTTSTEDAKAILKLAQDSAVPVMSCSSLRYADVLTEALNNNTAGPITGCDVYGPMNIEPPLEGLYWYGVHTVEVIVTILGAGCKRVSVVKNEGTDLVTAEWADGRIATIRGVRGGSYKFGALIHRKEDVQFVDASACKRPYYATMLEAILRSLPEGRSAIDNQEMLDAIRIIDAANESRQTGKAVELN